MSRISQPILRGAPIPISFLGFQSDTFALQRAGWQIAEERSLYDSSLRIAIRHPEYRISGMSTPTDKRNLFKWAYAGYAHEEYVIDITLAIEYTLHVREERSLPKFIPVDATPSYEMIESEYDLYDMPYFRQIDQGKEIFIREASVDEIIQIALDKQEPEHARIMAARQAEKRREEYRRGGETKAKIIAI